MGRVIAGAAGGRRLVTPPGAHTRPTSDRVREALFSTLLSMLGDLAGISFLDLYAGSGAVGLEASSRGAAQVMLVERDAKALRALRANVRALGATSVEVVGDRVERVLTTVPPRRYDVVFLDPPYADPVDGVLDALSEGGWLAPEGVVCVERATRGDAPMWPDRIAAARSRRYGDSTLWYGRAP